MQLRIFSKYTTNQRELLLNCNRVDRARHHYGVYLLGASADHVTPPTASISITLHDVLEVQCRRSGGDLQLEANLRTLARKNKYLFCLWCKKFPIYLLLTLVRYLTHAPAIRMMLIKRHGKIRFNNVKTLVGNVRSNISSLHPGAGCPLHSCWK